MGYYHNRLFKFLPYLEFLEKHLRPLGRAENVTIFEDIFLKKGKYMLMIVVKKEKRIAMSTLKNVKSTQYTDFFFFFKLFNLSIFPSEMRLRLSTEDDS